MTLRSARSRIVTADFPGARLSIAGSGPELDSLRTLGGGARSGRRVQFTGRLETAEIVSLYQSADVVLNPSRADNMPNSILEALACGVPVVSTNVGGVPYLVEHGRTAWLVPLDDAECMAAGIVHVLGDAELRATLVDNGCTLARSLRWPVVREQWLSSTYRLAKAADSTRRPVRPDMYTRLCSSILFPLHERIKGHHSVALQAGTGALAVVVRRTPAGAAG